jgi:Zn ribbon nucleic-acid-binding protein
MDIISFPHQAHQKLDVTSLARPDTDWVYRDKKGHVHRWSPEGGPYDARKEYTVPTVVFVKDGVEWWGEEEHDIGHEECARCGERIEPRMKPDDSQTYVRGLAQLTDLEVRLDLNLPDDNLLLETCLDHYRSGELMTILDVVGIVVKVQINENDAYVSLRPSGGQD